MLIGRGMRLARGSLPEGGSERAARRGLGVGDGTAPIRLLRSATLPRGRDFYSAGWGTSAGRATGRSSIGRLMAAEARPRATESHQTTS
jgi:hypothetical protein